MNLAIEAQNELDKSNMKNGLAQAFYGAYFYAKSQNKGGIKSSDLTSILDKIDKPVNTGTTINKAMTEESIFDAIKAIHSQFGGEST